MQTRTQKRTFGIVINESISAAACGDEDANGGIPETRLVAVSKTKFEPVPALCRNLVAVSDRALCYVASSKRNVVRVIDTSSGVSAVLSKNVHETYITDVKFSVLDRSIICSADGNKSVLWQIKPLAPDGLSADIIYTLSVPTFLVQNHPRQPLVWAFASTHALTVTAAIPDASVTTTFVGDLIGS